VSINEKLKKSTLTRPNLLTNTLDNEFIKKALLESENGEKFGELLEEKGYEFTIVHDMEERHGEEDIFEIMKEYGCLPVPDGVQCPYCEFNRYGGNR
jgi:hypothetical protein